MTWQNNAGPARIWQIVDHRMSDKHYSANIDTRESQKWTHGDKVIQQGDVLKTTFGNATRVFGLFDRMYRYSIFDRLYKARCRSSNKDTEAEKFNG